ncbi:MAG: hypothetical protein AMXMBFR84_23620 [Candidatus Hydrogenedentota bacterium]
MIPAELAKKVRYIQIYTSKAVNDVLAGEYHSVFKGRGMEFDEVREYVPGDEIRTIDWNVTARTGRPHVKRYREERELTLMLLVDLSASQHFGAVQRLKNEVATELCALLAFSAIKNNDKVGLVVFTDEIELYIPPKKGTSHVLRVIRDLLAFAPRRKGTNIALALDFLGRVVSKRCVTFLISDFIGSGYDRSLRVVARRHDLVAVTVTDPRESHLPKVGMATVEDAETGETWLLDTSSAAVRSRYEAAARARAAQLRDLFVAIGIDHISAHTNRDYVRDLVTFFRRRERRMEHG